MIQRVSKSTERNNQSSRSHAICQIRFDLKQEKQDPIQNDYTSDPDLEQWVFFLSTVEQRSQHTIRAYQRELRELHDFFKT